MSLLHVRRSSALDHGVQAPASSRRWWGPTTLGTRSHMSIRAIVSRPALVQRILHARGGFPVNCSNDRNVAGPYCLPWKFLRSMTR